MSNETGEITLSVFGAAKVGKSGMYRIVYSFRGYYIDILTSVLYGEILSLWGRCRILSVNIVYMLLLQYILYAFLLIWFPTQNMKVLFEN
jgi:hypothetical protein